MKFNSDKIKKIVILILILWILTEIFLISPIAVSVGENAVKSAGEHYCIRKIVCQYFVFRDNHKAWTIFYFWKVYVFFSN